MVMYIIKKYMYFYIYIYKYYAIIKNQIFCCYRCGKRKRSCRERSTDCDMRSLKPNRNTKSKNRIKIQTEDGIDCSRISSSSISSSDSETGLMTNDEDREGN